MTGPGRVLASTNRAEVEAAPQAPPPPQTIRDTGISVEAILDLLVKSLYVQGARTGRGLAEGIRLPFALLDEILQDLQQRQLVEVRGTRGHGRGSYVFDLTSAGRQRAREAMETNLYVGPAPVPFDDYREWVERQSVRQVHVQRDEIVGRLRHLVIDPEFLEQLGPAINSAKSMFLYGHSGNGKTAIAEAIAEMIGGGIYLPYAIEVEGQIVLVHDPVYHRAADDAADPTEDTEGPDWLPRAPGHDRRYARVARPVVFAGGELTLAELDLRYDTHTKFYQAPFQMKANGGVLIIDDLGRQLVSPRDLLNRWIVPLEKRVDYLTFHTGHKVPVPFDCLLIFATNLDPTDLVDEAFLRRIHYKIHVSSPAYEMYERIFQRCCQARGLAYEPDSVRYVFDRFYSRPDIQPRSCHPRDIVDHLCDTAKFLGQPAALTEFLVSRACESYFLDMPGES